MKNLRQFQNVPHDNFRSYMQENKGVDIGSNFDIGKMTLSVLVGLTIVTGGIGIAKWLQQRQERKDNQNSRVTNTRNMF